MTSHDFHGTVILTAQQMYDLLTTAAETGARNALENFTTTKDRPEYCSAAEAADILKYKSKTSLRTWHHKGLTPVRRGKCLFYKTEEVEKLKNTLFK